MAPPQLVDGRVRAPAKLVAWLYSPLRHLVAGWVVAVAGWFVSHVWRQQAFWLELAPIHGPMAPPGELLSTKEGWFLLAVVLLGIPGMVYGVLLGTGALTLWVVAHAKAHADRR
jgi:hypothetical protein